MCEPDFSDGADRIAGAADPLALWRLVSEQIPGHFAAILESLPDALLIVDRDGRIAVANGQAERMFGYPRTELIGQPIEILVPAALRAAHRVHRTEYMDRPLIVPMGPGPACRCAVLKDGTELPVEVALSPLRTEAGLLVICAVRDVTERTLAAKATEFHLAVEHITGAILRASLAAKSLDDLLPGVLDLLFAIPWIALQSQGAVFLLGDSPDALVMRAQRGLGESVQALCARIPPGSCLCGVAAQTRDVVFAGEVDSRHTTTYEGMLPHGHYCLPIVSDGRLHGVVALYLRDGHRWNAQEEAFLRSIADVLAGAIVRLQLTDDLRRSEERFALAIKGTDAGIWDWDIRGNRMFYSPRWKSMLGFAESELEDDYLEWERRIHPDDRVAALAALQQYMEGNRDTYELEHRLLHRDGTYRWILSRGAAVRDALGRPYRMVGSHLDITRSKSAEDAVRTNTAKLTAAQRIQERLLPASAPAIAGYDIAGRLFPAEFAAGDHFDYLPMDRGALGLMIGDVSGHGVDSALIMASVHAYLRLLAPAHTDLADIVRRTNALLAREIEPGRFVTVVLGRLDPGTGLFAYVNAGHPPAYLLDAAGSVKACLESSCIPLGIMPDASIPDASAVTMVPGDVLVFVTDGVTEAESEAGVPFGADRVVDLVRNSRRGSANEIISALWTAMREFCGRSAFTDDATAIVIKAERTPSCGDVPSGRR